MCLFAPKSDEVRGGWMRLNCHDLHDLHSSPDTPILRTMKSSMKWVAVGACGTCCAEENWLHAVGGETRGKEEHFET